MQVNTEIQMRKQDVKETIIQLALCGLFLLVHTHLLITAIDELPFALAHEGHFPLTVFVICFALVAIAVAGWYFILFSVQVRKGRLISSELTIRRFFAPEMQVSLRSIAIRQAPVVVPSLNAPYFRRGILFVAGAKLFFVSNDLPQAKTLIDQIVEIIGDRPRIP